MTADPRARSPRFSPSFVQKRPGPEWNGACTFKGRAPRARESSVNFPLRFKTPADAKPEDEPAPRETVHVASNSHGRAGVRPEPIAAAALAARAPVRPHNRAHGRLRVARHRADSARQGADIRLGHLHLPLAADLRRRGRDN